MDEKVRFALDLIRESIKKYKRIAFVCSFGKDSMVTLDLIRRIKPDILVLWIKTPFLFDEVIEFANKIIKDWSLNVRVVENERVNDADWLEHIVYKPKLWKTNPELCCQLFKVEPIIREVNRLKLQAWFSGLRRTESEKRGMYTHIWRQGSFVKIHPILDFTEADVWRYLATHDVPVCKLYAEGYRSLGCKPCSFPNVWYAERGGRWKDTLMEGGDCGIHCTPPNIKLDYVAGLRSLSDNRD